jgi:hypothetical protein
MPHLTPLSLLTILVAVAAACIKYCHPAAVLAFSGEGADAAFWVKVFFSATLCASAMHVILSKKYDDETRKWAFSLLTLVAGVWVGTVTS